MNRIRPSLVKKHKLTQTNIELLKRIGDLLVENEQVDYSIDEVTVGFVWGLKVRFTNTGKWVEV